MKSRGLGYQKIDTCLKFCMLYYFENANLTDYKTYGHARYKPKTGREKTIVAHRKKRYFSITHKLQRLSMSSKTIEHLTWHHSHDVVDVVIVHPSDDEAYK